MNKNSIDIGSAPIGTRYVGIDSIWGEEIIIKINEEEICFTRKFDGEEICEICKIMKNEYNYYFVSQNKSIFPITNKYYKQVSC